MDVLKVKNRNLKLDNLKFLLIFLVVLGHISEKYTGDYTSLKVTFLTIYVFHMPAFLFVSGLLSKSTIDKKKYQKIFSYLMLYFAIKVFRNGINYIINGKGGISLLSESGTAWYVGALFAYCIVTLLLRRVDKRWLLICVVILGCICGYDQSIGDYLILSRIIVYYPFFLLGYMSDVDKLMTYTGKISFKVVSSIGMLLFLSIFALYGDELYWIRPLLTGRKPFSELEYFSMYGLILRFIYYIVVMLIIFMLISVVPNIRIPLLTGIGSRSLAVYSLQFFFIDVIWGVFGFGDWMQANTTGLWFYFGMVIMSAFIVVISSLPVFVKMIRFLTTPRLIQVNGGKNE